LTAGKSAKLALKVRWFADPSALSPISIVPAKMPAGINIEAVQAKAGAERVEMVVKVDEHFEQTAVPIALKASVRSGTSLHTRTTADIAIKVAKEKSENAVASK
jgi:hypothetical protein